MQDPDPSPKPRRQRSEGQHWEPGKSQGKGLRGHCTTRTRDLIYTPDRSTLPWQYWLYWELSQASGQL